MLVVTSTAAIRPLSRRDPPERGTERVHDDRRRASSRRHSSAASTWSLLGDMPLTATQVSTFTGWVNAGGNLIAMRPDKQLAACSGSQRRRHALERVPARSTPRCRRSGHRRSTMQYHGTADRYALNGATAVAHALLELQTATANPAVTLRSVGSSGGQAAAFTYDLARSVVYTRQGNPAWAGQERDGVTASARTTCSTAPRSATSSRLARHEQDRDSAGRRAAAAAGQPDHV